ncbi:hypothetical protein FRX31_026115 [Thalictrum thalictroides]|uniref:Uncharacterized protein n=1 Tax=Thalictrum thalictroides TaxID=46969 RepID=A0A7J6VI86_THATH|nr:hypothetical protein FRX31_026115 [Thalictrum thalictroides]
MACLQAYNFSQNFYLKSSCNLQVQSSNINNNQRKLIKSSEIPIEKRCLRCNTLYQDKHNSPTACSFHGYITGEIGLFSLAPPHQGIDGEWTDRSGVIVYKWNETDNRPNTGRANWKKRWSCCSEYGENAPPCCRGWHVSYDDGFTMY